MKKSIGIFSVTVLLAGLTSCDLIFKSKPEENGGDTTVVLPDTAKETVVIDSTVQKEAPTATVQDSQN